MLLWIGFVDCCLLLRCVVVGGYCVFYVVNVLVCYPVLFDVGVVSCLLWCCLCAFVV